MKNATIRLQFTGDYNGDLFRVWQQLKPFRTQYHVSIYDKQITAGTFYMECTGFGFRGLNDMISLLQREYKFNLLITKL